MTCNDEHCEQILSELASIRSDIKSLSKIVSLDNFLIISI